MMFDSTFTYLELHLEEAVTQIPDEEIALFKKSNMYA